jgi:hypothetical protein
LYQVGDVTIAGVQGALRIWTPTGLVGVQLGGVVRGGQTKKKVSGTRPGFGWEQIGSGGSLLTDPTYTPAEPTET